MLLIVRLLGQVGLGNTSFASTSDDIFKRCFEDITNSEECFQCRIPHASFNVAHHLLRQPGTLSNDIH
jgi:hypothetical protein